MKVKELIDKLKLANPESKVIIGTNFLSIEGEKSVRLIHNSDLFDAISINDGEEIWLLNEGANDMFYENNEKNINFISRDFNQEIESIKDEAKGLIKKMGKKKFINQLDTFLSAVSVSKSESESTNNLSLKMKNLLSKNKS